MPFNWSSFFDQHHIEVATSGPNVSRGHVAVHCPFCGSADQSQHMSVSLEGKGWRCFRQPDHRGKNPARLVRALLGCSFEQAQRIVGNSLYIPEDFAARVHLALVPQSLPAPRTIRLPHEFKPITVQTHKLPSARPFLSYLTSEERGFTTKQALRLYDDYDLLYCTQGAYHGRIIFPVYFRGKLITWTGRTRYKSEALRYKTLSDDEERAAKEGLAPAIGPISDYLLWYDDLRDIDADTLYLCEGPFDALKVNVLGRPHGIAATCFFTSSPSVQQVNLLHALIPRFKRSTLLLDQDTLPTALKVLSSLSGLGVSLGKLPSGVKDPGGLDLRTLLKIDETQALRSI